MKRCNSVPNLKENGTSELVPEPRQRSPPSPGQAETRMRSRSNSVLDISAVMQKIERILGTPNFEACDLNTITKEQFAMLNSVMQEAKLVEQPASIVWKNLSYIKDERRVFQGISGFAKPGMMICCLGPSSSGISSFLRVLANRNQGGLVHGEILLNGVRMPSNFRQVVSYVPFEDLHIGHMKVKEAIRFSISLRASPRLPQRFLDLHARIILHLLNLSHRSRSLIGGGTLRGISGGERRRLTIGLEVAAGNSIMVMDSPTNGLDSVSAMELAKITKALVVNSGRSAIMSLAQASPDLFGMFDYLLCLSQSELIYFGPVTGAVSYMNSLGYRKPAFRNVPDFLSDICADPSAYYYGPDPTGDLILTSSYWNKARNQFFKVAHERPDPHQIKGGTIRALAESYRKSVLFEEVGRVVWQEQAHNASQYKLSVPLYQQSLAGAVREAFAKNALNIRAKKEGEPASKVNSFKQFYALFVRAILLNIREKSKSLGRVARAILVAVVTGTIFWRLEDSQAGALSKLGTISVAAGFLGFDAVDEIPQIFQSRSRNCFRFIQNRVSAVFRSMFYAQRNAGYFSVFSYFVAHLLADLPIIIAQTSIFSVIIYAMTGMRDGVFSVRFLIFALLILQTAMAGRAWTTFMANFVPNESMAITMSILLNDVFWYFQGYFRKADEIPAGWKWVHYISYFSRLFQALAINELDGLELNCAATDNLCRWQTGNDLLREFYWDTGDTAIGLWLQSFIFLGIFHCLSIACMLMLNFEYSVADDPVASGSSGKKAREAVEMASGLERSDRAHIVEFSDNALTVVPSMIKPPKNLEASQGICMVARQINYHVGDLHLLKNINLFAKPGMLIAMMGASGAGKSTLIDVLAQRKTTGTITGSITVNGQTLSRSNLRRLCAYVEQFDSLPAFCTVREIIECNAKLRLPADYSPEKRTKLVNELLESLHLSHVQHEIANGLSGAVRKKVSIAAELASIQPQTGILFCDEPTTGLDSPAAMDIVTSISRVSEHTPVICTIHQPSMELMTSFNWILLLRAGGIPVYFGPTCEVADFCVKSGYPPLMEKENLAEYVLRTICKGPPKEDSFALDPLSVPLPDKDSLPDSPPFQFRQVSWFRRFRTLLERRFKCELRDKYALYARLCCSTFFGLVLGSIFYQLPLTYAGMMARVSFFFCIVNNVTWSQCAKVSNIVNDRPSYYRELALGMYDESAYFLSWSLAETPFLIAQVFCASVAPYFLAGMSPSPSTFLSYFLTMWLVTESASGGIHFLTALSPNTIISNGLITAVYTTFMAFSGFLLVYSAMSSFTMVFFYISFFRYAVFSSVAGEASTLSPDAFMCDIHGVGINCRDDILHQYGIHIDGQWLYIAELCCVLIAFRILAIIALKAIKHIKR